MSMYLQTTGTHRSDPPTATCHHTVMPYTRATQDTDTTTTVMLLMREDMQHPEILTCQKALKRREIETTNRLEISTQMVSDRQRKNVAKIVKEREVIMNELILKKRVGLVA